MQIQLQTGFNVMTILCLYVQEYTFILRLILKRYAVFLSNRPLMLSYVHTNMQIVKFEHFYRNKKFQQAQIILAFFLWTAPFFCFPTILCDFLKIQFFQFFRLNLKRYAVLLSNTGPLMLSYALIGLMGVLEPKN